MSAVEMLEDLTGKVDGLEDRFLALLDRQDQGNDFRSADAPAGPLTPAPAAGGGTPNPFDGTLAHSKLIERLQRTLERNPAPSSGSSAAAPSLPLLNAQAGSAAADAAMPAEPRTIDRSEGRGWNMFTGERRNAYMPMTDAVAADPKGDAMAEKLDKVVTLLEEIRDGIRDMGEGSSGQSGSSGGPTGGPVQWTGRPTVPQLQEHEPVTAPSVSYGRRQ